MERGTGMFAAIISLSLLLSSIACTAAAAVTHGDLLMLQLDGVGPSVQFYSPAGKLKAAVTLRAGCNDNIWGHAVSQDGRYAAIGCAIDKPNVALFPRPIDAPLQVIILQLAGPSPKILGTKVLPGVNDGKSCYRYASAYVSTSPLALRSRPLARGAGAVLDVYLSILCPAAKAPTGCEGLGENTAAAAIQHWSVVHTKKLKRLGPLMAGDRAMFPETTRCGAFGLSIVVTANGKTHAAFGFNAAKGRLRRTLDTIGIYEVRRSPRQRTRLIRTWKFQTRPLSVDVLKFLATGPVTGCALGFKTTATGFPGIGGMRVYSFAKGRSPYIGGIRVDNDPNIGYGDISCKGSGMYATFTNLAIDANTNRVLKVSNKELRKGASGRVVFRTPLSVSAISIIP